MSSNKITIKAVTVSKKFKDSCVKFDHLLAHYNSAKLTQIRQKLRNELKLYQEQSVLTIAFVGQYSSGKSTIISALTGRRDIQINSDITTQKTTTYSWNGIKLIDTPGLFTEWQDHDEITYAAIAKADLLVFCLTSMLFDSVTIENFKQLAYQKGYRWKMMLVVNKMSDEAGDDQQKIANYSQSLAEAIYPYSLDEFPICFIDAKDYCEGVDQKEDFFIEVSRFKTFIDKLNTFVERRGYLAKFDTPVRIALSCIDETQWIVSRNSNQDSAFLEILTRLSRLMRKERDRLRTNVNMIALRLSSAIVKEGTLIASGVVTNVDFERLNQQAELKVRTYYDQVQQELKSVVNAAINSRNKRINEFLDLPLVETFLTCVTQSKKDKLTGVNVRNLDGVNAQINWIKSIGDTGKYLVNNTTTSEELKITEGETSEKVINYDFKPWQDLDIAKRISSMAKFMTTTLEMVSDRRETSEMHRELHMADIRRYITSQFQAISQELQNQIQIECLEFERQVYGEIEKKIMAAYTQESHAIAASNQSLKHLAEIRHDFEAILNYITQGIENPRV